MKLVLALLLSISTQAAQDQSVADAVGIFSSCLLSKKMYDIHFSAEEMKNEKEMVDYLMSVDACCLNWTQIWLYPLADSSMSDWNSEQVSNFNLDRGGMIRSYANGLIPKQTLIRR